MKRLSIRLSVVGAIIALGGFALFQGMKSKSSAANEENQVVEGEGNEGDATGAVTPIKPTPLGASPSSGTPNPSTYSPGKYGGAHASFTTPDASSGGTNSGGTATNGTNSVQSTNSKDGTNNVAGGASSGSSIPQPGFENTYSVSDGKKSAQPSSAAKAGESTSGNSYSLTDTKSDTPSKPAVQNDNSGGSSGYSAGSQGGGSATKVSDLAKSGDNSTLPKRLLGNSSTVGSSTVGQTGSADGNDAAAERKTSADGGAGGRSLGNLGGQAGNPATGGYQGSAQGYGNTGSGAGSAAGGTNSGSYGSGSSYGGSSGYQYGGKGGTSAAGTNSGYGTNSANASQTNKGTSYRGGAANGGTGNNPAGKNDTNTAAANDGSAASNPATATITGSSPATVGSAAIDYAAKNAATGSSISNGAGQAAGNGSSSGYGAQNPAVSKSQSIAGSGGQNPAATSNQGSGYSAGGITAQGYSSGGSAGNQYSSGTAGDSAGPNAGIGYAPPATVGSYGGAAQAVPGDATLEGRQQPTITIEKQAPSELQVNRSSNFVTIVRNAGRVTADNVLITDRVPQGTRLVSTNPKAEQLADGRLSWSLGSLEPGREEKLTMTLMPTREGSIGSVATVSFQARASVKTVVTQPKLSVRQTLRPQVMIGDDLRIDIAVSNPGTGDATNVVLEEDVPEGMTHPAGKALEYDIGTIRPGETKRLSLVLKAAKAGRMSNRLLVHGAGSLKSENAVPVEVIAPQLQLQIKGPSRRYLNRPASLTMTVHNPGTAVAKNVDLQMRLPKGLKFVSAGNQGEYNARDHSVFWSLAELRPGEQGVVKIALLPQTQGAQVVKLDGRASSDIRQSSQYTMNVESLPEVVFTVSDTVDPVELGADTTYEIELQNRGSRAATQVVMAVDLPPGMTPSAQQPSVGPRAAVEGQRFRFPTIPQLLPGQKIRYRVSARGTQGGDHIIRVQVASAEFSKPVSKEESTTVYTDSPQ